MALPLTDMSRKFRATLAHCVTFLNLLNHTDTQYKVKHFLKCGIVVTFFIKKEGEEKINSTYRNIHASKN